MEAVSLSNLDEKRFGIITARADHISMENFDDVVSFCRKNKVKLLIARCRTEDLNIAQRMEENGFFLCDTLIYYKNLLKENEQVKTYIPVTIRPFKKGEENKIKEIAAAAFKNYISHYSADNRLDSRKCDEVYADWAYNSCINDKVANIVLVAELQGKITGFLTIKLNDKHTAEIRLNGVLPEFQKKGIYTSLVTGAIGWCNENNIHELLVSSQITNIAVQKTWIKCGFLPTHSFYTYHKWFD